MEFSDAVVEWPAIFAKLVKTESADEIAAQWESLVPVATALLKFSPANATSSGELAQFHQAWSELIHCDKVVRACVASNGGDANALERLPFPTHEPSDIERLLQREDSRVDEWKKLFGCHKDGDDVFVRNLSSPSAQSLTKMLEEVRERKIRFLHFHLCSLEREFVAALRALNHPQFSVEVVMLFYCPLPLEARVEAANVRVLYRVE